MPQQSSVEAKGLQIFRRKKVLTILELTQLFNCSGRTVQRHLKRWKYLTSYNHNGRYHTLPEIPSFDVNGHWGCRGILFSKRGTLKKTLIHIVKESPCGLSATEIGKMLRMNTQSFLSQYRNEPLLYREKFDGCFVWFAAEIQLRKKQRKGRLGLESQHGTSWPSDREAVMILVDLLRHPGADETQIARRLKQKALRLDSKVVHAFLSHHDLLKKTTDLRS